MPIVPPVVLVPGITATFLRDEYLLPPETVWAVLRKGHERIALHPDNVRYEAAEPALLRSDQIYEIAYKELVEELRYNLREKEDEPVPVFPFGYDWRQPLHMIEQQLGTFVDEVIERTKLLRHYHKAGYAEDLKVNLLGHSMGGLIVTGYLDRYGKDSRAAKVATLATPFKGSFEAIVRITTGTAEMGTEPPSSREREAARITPALYHLLPTCPGLEVPEGLPQGIFHREVWQPSILHTLGEYVRLHGVGNREPAEQAFELFAHLLDTAQRHRARMEGFRLSKARLKPKDWLCVAGVDAETRVGLGIKLTPAGPAFEFRSRDRQNRWATGKNAEERKLTGDGTVPLEAAIPAFLGSKNLVCVSPSDYGYWEIQDKVVASAAGFHGTLPNMDMLHRLIVRHFTGRPDTHGNTWGRCAPGVTRWQPPLELKRKD